MAKEVKNNGRILYYEPNDSVGYIDGVPVTPEYSDLCISFSLTVEVVNRFRRSGNKAEYNKYVISWNSPYNSDGTLDRVSFMQGDDSTGVPNLTTYYTETTFDDIRNNKHVVEGLGVESVDLAFENYYTPTVTIKFVDQRGSALFGREEVYHTNDKITSDTVFGCFFTQPYPRFRLQMKGFFGKPVTYQLVCSGFKGSLNTDTGNFEAVASFIGYQYGILTDIPFQYLISAPYCDYVGRDYWNANKTKWTLMDGSGQTMPTIYEYFQLIKAALEKKELYDLVLKEDEELITSIQTINADLSTILSKMLSFVEVFSTGTYAKGSYVHGFENSDGETQVLYTYESEDISPTGQDITSYVEELKALVDEYNENNEDNKLNIPEGTVFDGFPEKLSAADFFVPVLTEENTFRYSYPTSRTLDPDSLTGVIVQPGGRRMTSGLSRVIYNDAIGKQDNMARYAYLLSFGDIPKQIYGIRDRSHAREKEIRKITDEKYLKAAKQYLNMVPYVGNVIHMIMAHVETFTSIFYKLNETISQTPSLRKPMALGLRPGATDMVYGEQDTVPAWPSVYSKRNEAATRYDEGENGDNVVGWVGDLSDNFEEEKFVRSLYRASYKSLSEGVGTGSFANGISFTPVSGIDIFDDAPMFVSGYGMKKEKILSDISGMIGIRVAQLFGVCDRNANRNIAYSAGIVDGYNLYLCMADRQLISEITAQKPGGKIVSDIIESIMTCGEDGDEYASVNTADKKRHCFETAKWVYPKSKDGRHPVLVKSGDTYSYTYMNNSEKHGIVPVKICAFGEGSVPYPGYVWNNDERYPYFTVDPYAMKKSSIYLADSDVMIPRNGDGGGSTETEGYSEKLITIHVDDRAVGSIMTKYGEMKNGRIRVMSDTYDVKDSVETLLSRYWMVENSDYGKYLKISITERSPLTAKYESVGLEGKLWSEEVTPEITYPGIQEALNKVAVRYDSGSGNFSVTAENGEKKDYGLNSLAVTRLDFHTYRDDKTLEDPSIFACRTFCGQNTEEGRAFLFLMCLPYDWNMANSVVDHSFIASVPYGYAAAVGAYLWRRKKIDDGEGDPVLVDASIYKKAEKNEVYAFEFGMRERMFVGGVINAGANKKYVNWGALDKLDKSAKEVFVSLFISFVNGKWRKIQDSFSTGYDSDELKRVIDLLKGAYSALRTVGADSVSLNTTFSAAFSEMKNFKSGIKYASPILRKIPTGNVDCRYDGLWLFFDDKGEAQEALKYVMFSKVVLCASRDIRKGRSTVGEYGDINISGENVRLYIDGVMKSFDDIAKNATSDTKNASEIDKEDESGIKYDRDIMISIYRYLKNIWDKWLSQENQETYTVENFFLKNFVFMDSVYRDIRSRYMMNCQILLDVYESVKGNRDISLYTYIADTLQEHHFMFLSLPDFVPFGGKSSEAKESLEMVFTPVPYTKMPAENLQNRFVCVYVANVSNTPSGDFNGYRDETLNVWSMNGVNDNVPDFFKRLNFLDVDENEAFQLNETQREMVRYGYNVPAFGVTFGRQNNHLFKNVRVNMENPVMTSAAINTLSHIIMKGSGNDHEIAFVGQDIYPIFSNYSYIAEVEMMGDAQIQPLMYFQLMNIPMWRGTYMIFSVRHYMTPGNMTTVFKGVKLSNNVINYTNVWFTKRVNFNRGGNNGTNNECDPESDPPVTNGSGFNGPVDGDGIYRIEYIKNPNMKKVFKDVKHYNTDKGTMTVTSKSADKCASSVQTWYGNAGVSMSPFWGKPYPPYPFTEKCNYAQMSNVMKSRGFVERMHGSFEDAKKWQASMYRPGDVALIFGIKNGSKPTAHTCMWVGNHWRSDFTQGYKTNPCVYSTARGDLDKAVSIWYRPDFQEDSVAGGTSVPSQTAAGDDTKTSDTSKKNSGYYIVVHKEENGNDNNVRLEVYDKSNRLVAKYPACVGKNKGNKQKSGDMKTPVSPQNRPFKITQIQDSSTWTHDFKDGKGKVKAYGKWFLRLGTAFSGIGIHGSTGHAYTVPGRGSNGCVRLRDADIIQLKEKYAYVGMSVIIKED